MNTKALIIGIIATLFLSACNKKDGLHTGIGTSNGLSALHKKALENKTQSFAIDASTWEAITGDEGTTLYIQPGTFVTKSGSAVNGTVEIELVELYNKSDMLFTNKTTFGINGSLRTPLISGGQFYITAKQNGEELLLAQSIQLVTKDQNTDLGMDFFNGRLEEDDNIIWDQNDTAFVEVVRDSAQGGFGSYAVGIDSLNYCNIDVFMSTGPSTDITVTLPDGLTFPDHKVYLNFEDQQTLVYVPFDTDNVFSTVGTHYKIPVGQKLNIVVIGSKDDVLSYNIKELTVGTDQKTTISDLQPATEQELRTAIKALD